MHVGRLVWRPNLSPKKFFFVILFANLKFLVCEILKAALMHMGNRVLLLARIEGDAMQGTAREGDKASVIILEARTFRFCAHRVHRR
jgi:hypothetical protein